MDLINGSRSPNAADLATLGLKQFRRESCQSYVVYDRGSGQAAVIDPSVEMLDAYRTYLAEQQLRLVWAIDTQLHADHRSATYLLRREFGAGIGMSAATRSERPTQKWADGAQLNLGGLSLRVLATPGRSPDSICLLVAERALFTGDTLGIGGVGRADFPDSDQEAFFTSLQRINRETEAGTLVYPAHEPRGILFSIIAVERVKNPYLSCRTYAEYLELRAAEGVLPLSEDLPYFTAFNRASQDFEAALPSGPSGTPLCGTACRSEPERFGSIGVEKYQHKLHEQAKKSGRDMLFLDVRDPEEFRAGHIPGSRNLALSELGLHWSELAAASRIYVSCQSGRRSSMAAQTLSYLGLRDVVDVSGGYQAWVQAGLPTEAS